MLRRLPSLLLAALLACSLAFTGCASQEPQQASTSQQLEATGYEAVAVDEPSFTEEEISYAEENPGYESYSKLDDLGRCGTAQACLGPETMPDKGEERGSIGMVKPSGWHTVKYDTVDGKYLYNRCHLIGWQLGAENANERNLVTGTRWMNTEEMLPYEDEVADYIHDTGNHVLYRATPEFAGDDLVCQGVRLEALSIEDGGQGVSFNVWCPNTQPGIAIDYATGASEKSADTSEVNGAAAAGKTSEGIEQSYVLNTNTMKFHKPDCPSIDDIGQKNRRQFTGARDELISQGYEPCGRCKP